MKKILLAIVFINILVLTSTAQQIVTDRPDQTEASSTVPQNSFQLESGILYQENHNIVRSLANNNLFRIGLLEGFELRIVSQLETLKYNLPWSEVTVRGFNDIEIGAKVQIINNESFEFGFLSHVIIPTGSVNFSNGGIGSINRFLITHKISEYFTLAYNVGVNVYDAEYMEFPYSLALGFGITDKLSVFLEPYGSFDSDLNPENSIDAGVTYLLRDNFQLDISLGTGIDHDMNFVSAGFSWLIVRKTGIPE